MFCEKCGTQISDGTKFCPKCGNQVIKDGNVSSPCVGQPVMTDKQVVTQSSSVTATDLPAEASNNGIKAFEFSQQRYWLMIGPPYARIVSNVSVDKEKLAMVQKRVSLLPFTNHDGKIVLNCAYKLSDVKAVLMNKVFSIGWIVYTVLCAVGTISTFHIIPAICMLVGLFCLRKKEIYVLTNDGQKLLLPDEGELGMETVKEFIQTVRNFNPQIQTNIVIN